MLVSSSRGTEWTSRRSRRLLTGSGVTSNPTTKSSAGCGGGAPLCAEVILSASSRMAAGGAAVDIIDLHGIGESSLRDYFMQVRSHALPCPPPALSNLTASLGSACEALCAAIRPPGLQPVGKRLRGARPLGWPPAALDGIAIRIQRPSLKNDVKATAYLNRHAAVPPSLPL